MKGTRTAALGAALLAGALALTGCGSGATPSGSAGGGTVRIALNNTNDSLPVAVAEQQGFFAKHGIKVTTKTLSDISLVPSLLGKQYDIGISVAPIMIRSKASGVPIVAVSGNSGDSPEDQELQVFTRPDTTDVKQLQGKRIGTPTLTGNLNIATRTWLAANGVDPNSEQFVQVPTPNMLDQLKAGRVDAVEVIPPFITLAQQAGMHSLGDPERALSDSYVGGTYWTADSSWATSNANVVNEFKGAIADADQWIKANPDQAYQASADYTKVSLDQAKLAPLSNYGTDITASDLKIWGDAMKKNGGFEGNVDYNTLVFGK